MLRLDFARHQPPAPRRTAFVLAGGGSLGAVQVGMLRALLEAGIRPDLIVGTSVGALNGAYLAGHAEPSSMDELAALWTSVRRRDVFPVSVPALARGLMGRRNFLFGSLGLRNVISRADLGYERLEDAPIPCHVVAADLDAAEVVVLSSGSVVDALLASAAIPGLFPSMLIGDRRLVDGSILASIPIAEAVALGASSIYVLPTLPRHLHGASSAFVAMQHALSLLSLTAADAAFDPAASQTTVFEIPAPAAAGQLSLFNFAATHSLIDEAYRTTMQWMSTEPAGELSRIEVGGGVVRRCLHRAAGWVPRPRYAWTGTASTASVARPAGAAQNPA